MRSRVTEWEWHGWRGFHQEERDDLFRNRKTYGFLTVYRWRHEGSLRQYKHDLETTLAAAEHRLRKAIETVTEGR